MLIHEILKKHWGFDEFRPLQKEIINSVLQRNDVLALLPTGGGKSVCFQVSSLAQEGLCIVVSPLIALMKDQVENLVRKNIKAIAITSAMNKHEIDVAIDNCVYGDYKFLYVSPERLSTDIFKARVKKMKVNLIAVDEAHCISQWGYDFRPSYLKIADLRTLLPDVPVLALTATATPEVVKDIQQKLLFKKENVLQKSFERKNLAYVVLKEEDKLARLLKICKNISGTGIVYVHNRKKTHDIVGFLRSSGIQSDFYHAGLPPHVRSEKQMNWVNNKTRVIVCTNAFGMGIDKPDVRFVVHLDLPDCIESYFQEAGRAGRDEKKAFAILLHNNEDRVDMEKNVKNNFPEIDVIKKTYHALGNFFNLAVGAGEGQQFEFDIHDFCTTYKLNAVVVFSSLKFLEKEGYLATTEALHQPSKLHFRVGKEALYTFQVENPKYDGFIKIILRSYGGVFDNYIKINENQIAQRCKVTREDVVRLLNYLEKLNLLNYIPQSELPRMIFTQQRMDAEHIHISPRHYAERKKKAHERMEHMIHYADENHQCRSRALLSYFGEVTAEDCSVCDICLEKKRKEFTNEEFDQIMEEIVNLLIMHKLSLQELLSHIPDHRDEKILKVVQWLLDNNEVHYDDKQKLCLTEK